MSKLAPYRAKRDFAATSEPPDADVTAPSPRSPHEACAPIERNLKPRKNVSGFGAADRLATMARATRDWADRIRSNR